MSVFLAHFRVRKYTPEIILFHLYLVIVPGVYCMSTTRQTLSSDSEQAAVH